MLSAQWGVLLLRGAVRGLHIAGSFSLFGTCLVAAFLIPPARRDALRLQLKILAWASFSALTGFGLIWFLLQAADMSGATDFADLWAALPVVAGATRFGNLLIGRTAAALLAALLLQCGLPKPAALLAGGSVIAEAWLGHGAAMTGSIGNLLLVSSVIHLAAGGAWLGALPALRLSLRRLPLADAARLAQKFSPLGIACVIGLIGSAFVQYTYLIGAPGALFTGVYGFVALFKILGLTILITLAAINRQRLTPRLTITGEPARRAILRSVTAELTLGLTILLAAGVLLQLTPPSMAKMLN